MGWDKCTFQFYIGLSFLLYQVRAGDLPELVPESVRVIDWQGENFRKFPIEPTRVRVQIFIAL